MRKTVLIAIIGCFATLFISACGRLPTPTSVSSTPNLAATETVIEAQVLATVTANALESPTTPTSTFVTTTALPSVKPTLTIIKVTPTSKPTVSPKSTKTSTPFSNTAQMIQIGTGVDTFWIDKTEITNDQFAKYVVATGYQTFAEKRGWSDVLSYHQDFMATQGANWRNPQGSRGDTPAGSKPVVQVTKDDAQQYCLWAGKRLPQWSEYQRAKDLLSKVEITLFNIWEEYACEWTAEGTAVCFSAREKLLSQASSWVFRSGASDYLSFRCAKDGK